VVLVALMVWLILGNCLNVCMNTSNPTNAARINTSTDMMRPERLMSLRKTMG